MSRPERYLIHADGIEPSDGSTFGKAVRDGRVKHQQNTNCKDPIWGKQEKGGMLREELEKIAGTSFDSMGPQQTDFDFPPIRP